MIAYLFLGGFDDQKYLGLIPRVVTALHDDIKEGMEKGLGQ